MPQRVSDHVLLLALVWLSRLALADLRPKLSTSVRLGLYSQEPIAVLFVGDAEQTLVQSCLPWTLRQYVPKKTQHDPSVQQCRLPASPYCTPCPVSRSVLSRVDRRLRRDT